MSIRDPQSNKDCLVGCHVIMSNLAVRLLATSFPPFFVSKAELTEKGETDLSFGGSLPKWP